MFLSLLQVKQLLQLALVQLCTDDAQTAGVVGLAGAHLVLAGHIVELQPAGITVDDTLARRIWPYSPESSSCRIISTSAVEKRLGVSWPQLVNTSSA